MSRTARPPIPTVLGTAILGLSGMGFPLTQLAIRRFGRTGAAVSAGVAGALLARDAYLLATGTTGRLQAAPVALLWAETATAAIATGTGLLLLRDPEVAVARQQGWRVGTAELLRRFAMGTLFGLHTMRFRTYLAPGSGSRAGSAPTPWAAGPR